MFIYYVWLFYWVFSSLQKAYSFSEIMEKGLRGDFEQALLHASKHIKVGINYV